MRSLTSLNCSSVRASSKDSSSLPCSSRVGAKGASEDLHAEASRISEGSGSCSMTTTIFRSPGRRIKEIDRRSKRGTEFCCCGDESATRIDKLITDTARVLDPWREGEPASPLLRPHAKISEEASILFLFYCNMRWCNRAS